MRISTFLNNSKDIQSALTFRLESYGLGNLRSLESIFCSNNKQIRMAHQLKGFEKLSPAERDDVLQEILRQMRNDPEKVQELAKSLQFLPNSMTQILDLTAFTFEHLSYDYIDLHCCDEVLCAAVHLAPNLRQLFFGRGQMLENFPDASNYAYFSLIINFRHLHILEVGGSYFNLSDLVFLCGNLPSLRVLAICSVQNRMNPFPGEEISNHLSNLRLLNIYYNEESHDAIRIIQNHLPNLDIVCGFLTHIGLTFDDFLSHESQRKTFTCDSDWFENPDAEIHLTHPNVVHLTVVDNASTRADLLPSFPGIESIKISGEVPTFYLRILERYGHNLCRVFLHYQLTHAHSYQPIFNKCPRLEYLRMVTTCNRHDGPMENVSLLKEINLTHICPWLSLLLSAPQLKTVVLTGLQCDAEDDITSIASLIAENRILSQLEILHIDLDRIGLKGSWFKSLASMIQDASAFLPKLENLKLSCDGFEYVALVKRMQRDEYFKMQFFTGHISVDAFDMSRTPDFEEQEQGEEMEQEQELVQEELQQEQEQEEEEMEQEQQQEEDISDVFIDQDLFDILLLYQKDK